MDVKANWVASNKGVPAEQWGYMQTCNMAVEDVKIETCLYYKER